ncbi:MAG TPA: hypothetical protein DDY14_06965 [Chromatiaceae bacterium]|jgi:predicted esterase YcpF (UPF0227 family)|nr:MAG: hypothetical protein N838_13550 [Thiohalocapsa sp. PB-PSB1]QQO57060.1 MAG: alpha/beta fold hydrolase [Thiohalocapsa sp. PB-PSB1]HBG95055.1 hypothetical protein [Chromatiaceae bacterium]
MIIYLHGLNSSSQSTKAKQLGDALAPISLLVPDYPAHRPHAAVAELTLLLAKLTRTGAAPVLIGSSMGAFYGQYLARQFPISHLFMINPALEPWKLLSDFVDQPMTTAAGVEYRLSADTINGTRAYAVHYPCDGDDDGVPTTLFLDQGDELIDYRVAQALYIDCGQVVVYPDGDHAFQHLEHAIGIIRDALHEGNDSAQR